MAYYNTVEATSFHSASSAAEESVYGCPDQTTEGAHKIRTFSDVWGTFGRREAMVNPPTSFWPAISYDPAVLATPPRTRAGGRAQPAVDEGFSNDHSGCPNGDDSETQAVPLDCWEDGRCEPLTDGLHMNVPTYFQPGADPAGLRPTPQDQAYGTNAEAGPSTSRPSGGRSATTPDAERETNLAEENEATTPKRTKPSKGKGRVRPWRDQKQIYAKELCEWVRLWMGVEKVPSYNQALEAVLTSIVPRIRKPASTAPCLYMNKRSLGKARNKDKVARRAADIEKERRRVEREHLLELSKFYAPPQEGRLRGVWTNDTLVSRVLRDIKCYDPKAFNPPEPPDDPIP